LCYCSLRSHSNETGTVTSQRQGNMLTIMGFQSIMMAGELSGNTG
jgi:hypothetical protein